MTTVREPLAHPQMTQWYEDLRAQATGQTPTATPRGLALFLNWGLPAWMAAAPPLTSRPEPVTRASVDPGTSGPVLDGLSVDLVGVLTEMALGSLRRCSS
jgi:hypothetical protein